MTRVSGDSGDIQPFRPEGRAKRDSDAGNKHPRIGTAAQQMGLPASRFKIW